MANQFYPLKVEDIEKTTEDCSLISLAVPEDLQDIFKFKQGQYLTFKAKVNGEELRRSYSLCSSPIDKAWKVAIKKIPDGRFSTYANESLQVGDTLEVMPPNGRFYCEVDEKAEKSYLAFAAGSGITPVHSIIKTHLSKEKKSHFTLFYLNRNVQSIILKEEVESLKNNFIGRFELYHFLTQEERDAPLFNGRIDEEKLDLISSKVLDFKEIDEFFICGPKPMIFLIRDYLMNLGIDKSQIHFELFNSPDEAPKKRKINLNDKNLSDVSIVLNDKKTNFKVSRDGISILDAALQQNADLPFACKGGVCCTCKAKILEGEVEMKVNYALEEDEIEKGYVLTCQAVPKSDKIIVDFDQ